MMKQNARIIKRLGDGIAKSYGFNISNPIRESQLESLQIKSRAHKAENLWEKGTEKYGAKLYR